MLFVSDEDAVDVDIDVEAEVEADEFADDKLEIPGDLAEDL